ncbi:MAG: response regulator [bacterium]|nr:response regulator [bacterium]
MHPLSIPPKKILVLDDEDLIITLLTKVFEFIQWKCIIVRDGTLAIEEIRNGILQNEPFDVALLDMNITHGMGGVETNQQIKQLQPSIYTILMSGSPLEDAMIHYHQYGFNMNLKKPFSIDQLLNILSSLP